MDADLDAKVLVMEHVKADAAVNAPVVMEIAVQIVLANQPPTEHLDDALMALALVNVVLAVIMNAMEAAVHHVAELVRVVHVHQVVAQPALDVLVVLQLVEADAQKHAMDVRVAVQELAVIIVIPLVEMHVKFNVEINAKQLVEHLAAQLVKIVAKINVMILVNQLMRLLVQIIHQQARQQVVGKIVLQVVIFIAQDALVIVLD